MSLLRGLLQRVLPRSTWQAIETESRQWHVTCPECGATKDLWSLGGIRYKARGNPRHRRRCWACGETRWMKIHREA